MTWFVITLLYFGGILYFNKCFFLTRVELKNKSSCDKVPSIKGNGDGNGRNRSKVQGECWHEQRFKRAIVIVIDALRYDFAAWDPDLENVQPFENKLVAIRDLLLSKPGNSLLVPFYADPPTTTMQRLKGMVTGGLPTFMEIKDDVASEGKRNMTFMGDDTWTVLFPEQFTRAFPHPSFNVKDLHTVDRGVLEHLEPEIRRNDWDFLIAHFLGVNHCGHRYGPDNEYMMDKLLEMNRAIDSTVQLMDEMDMDDTILLIFDDHGMTQDGNHGGAQDEEAGSALFMYSPGKLLLDNTFDLVEEV